ncbi:hypothetical protein NVP1029O_43 [Vibrio phage 1.029.O._10N.261.55.A7]|nr:hypothetical protein NVP1029O_43 [Vibrio phage 1.029.O._10N.261.55.A7]
MKHYINDKTGIVKGFKFDGARVMTPEEFDSYRNPPPTLDALREAKKSELRAACEAAINAGFVTDVLFPNSNYRNDRDQQQTMRDAATGGGKIWMNEAFTHHNQAQAEAVYSVSVSEKETHRSTYADKCAYLNDPDRTREEIEAVTFTSVE